MSDESLHFLELKIPRHLLTSSVLYLPQSCIERFWEHECFILLSMHNQHRRLAKSLDSICDGHSRGEKRREGDSLLKETFEVVRGRPKCLEYK